MSTVTPKLGLVKPTTLEQYALSVMNNNLDIIDAAAMQVDYAAGTVIDANWNFSASRWTRVRTGTKGIVIAEIVITLAAVAVPVNTAAPLAVAGVIPSGFMPLGMTSIPVQSALVSNAGAGQHIGVQLKSDGSFGIRSAAAAFTATAGSQFYWATSYRWDGVL